MNQDKVQEIINSLGIESLIYDEEVKGTQVVYSIKNSGDYSKVYSKLDNSTIADLDFEQLEMDEHHSTLVYLSDDYDITLYANFDDELYTLTLEEI